MKYIVMDGKSGDIFTEEFDSREDAISYADRDFEHLTASDKKHRDFYYILESINPDEDAENHFDGDIIKRYI